MRANLKPPVEINLLDGYLFGFCKRSWTSKSSMPRASTLTTAIASRNVPAR